MNRTVRAASLLPVLWFAACGGGGGGSGGDGGQLTLSVTDAPIDEAEKVFVTFTGIELRGNGVASERITFPAPIGLDVLALQGDNSAFLIQDADLPAGIYDEVRLFVAGEGNSSCGAPSPPYDSYITIGGVDYPLIVPSGTSSGYKIKGGITIAAGQRADYTVDFDLRKSIAQRGGTGCYNLRPVLRVVDNAVTGTLVGAVDPSLLTAGSCANVAGFDSDSGAGAAVYVYEGTVVPDDYDGLPADTLGNTGPDPLTTARLIRVPATGPLERFDYSVGFLLADRPYTVAFTCQAGNDVPPESEPPPVDEAVESDNVLSDNVLQFVQPQSLVLSQSGPNVVNFTTANTQ